MSNDAMKINRRGLMLVLSSAGKVLSGLVRRIERDMTGVNVGTPADVEAILNSL